MFYSGIDLHKDMSVITTINPQGTHVKQSKVPNTDFAILNYFDPLGSNQKAVVESTSNCYWLHDLLKSYRIKLILAHAKYLKMAFNEAAFRAVQYYSEIKKYYQGLSRRKHKSIARTLIAKELAKICYHILRNKTDYNNTFKGMKLSREKSMQWPRLASPDA